MIPSKIRQNLPWVVGLTVAVGAAWAATGPLRSHSFWMYFEPDDFFYYLKIAQNLAAGHGSTFNGLVPTNGYHPLWMLVLAAVSRVTTQPRGILVALAIIVWVATMSSYLSAKTVLVRSGIDTLAAAIFSAFVAAYCLQLFTCCMEVVLTVPLMFALIALAQSFDWWTQPGGWQGFLRSWMVGVLISAMVLSRLDSIIFAVLLGLLFLLQPSLRRLLRLPQYAGVAVGCLPVLAYLISNRVLFGVWLPISGMAKQLKLDHGFTSRALDSIGLRSFSQGGSFVCVLATLVLLPWLWKRLAPIERTLALAMLLFPFLYLVALSWLSDWRLWGWYLYCMRPALCAAPLVLLCLPRLRHWVSSPPVVALLFLVMLVGFAKLSWKPQMPEIAEESLDLEQFSRTHPGIYAMGDRAGMAAYRISDPIVQTEGLVMDRAFLREIAMQTPLRQTLAPYHARYYVATTEVPYSGCFQAVEPFQAGPHAPHMRDTFCQQPLAVWKHQNLDKKMIETMVFDLTTPSL